MPLCTPCSGQIQPAFKAQRRAPSLGTGSNTAGEAWVGRSSSQTPQCPLLPEWPRRELHLPSCARDALPSPSLTPGGQGGAGASLSKDPITSEHWANLHELRAHKEKRTVFTMASLLNNSFSGVTRDGKRAEGEGRGEHHSSLSCELLVSL